MSDGSKNKVPILKREDVLSGIMFMAVAAGAWLVAQDYPTGTAIQMGPGYFPRGLCYILFGLGALVTLSGLRSAAAATPSEPPPFALRPLVLIPLAVVGFALTLERFGLVTAIFVLSIVSAFADRGQRVVEVALATAVLALLTVAVFIWGVGIPLRVWPEF